MLKVLATNPDAIFVGASGTPADLPQIAAVDRGYRKQIYHTHGVVNPDFIRVGGKSTEGVIAPTGAGRRRRAAAGRATRSRRAGCSSSRSTKARTAPAAATPSPPTPGTPASSSRPLLPVALKTAKPGTPAFRDALRDAIEADKDVKGTHAVYNMSATDHYGVDKRARVLVKVDNGEWKLVR